MTSALTDRREGDTDTGRRSCEDGDGDWGDATVTQGVPGAPTNWKRQGKIYPSDCERVCSPATMLISDFWPPEERE